MGSNRKQIAAVCGKVVDTLAKSAYTDIVVPGQYEEKLNAAWGIIQNEYGLAPSQLKRVQQLCEKLCKEVR